MFEAINNWLKNGCNYQEGISLYERYGTNVFLKGVFKRSETAINRQKLNAELTAMRNSSVIPEIPIIPIAPAATHNSAVAPGNVLPVASHIPAVRSASQENAVPDLTTKPQLPELLQVIKQREQSWNEIRALHPLLSTEPEGESLRQVALQIVRQGKKNAQLWQRYNYLSEHNAEDEQQVGAPLPPAPVLIDANLLNQAELIRKALNKAQNRIKGVKNPKQKTLDLIAQKTLELKEIRAKIAAIKKGGAQ